MKKPIDFVVTGIARGLERGLEQPSSSDAPVLPEERLRIRFCYSWGRLGRRRPASALVGVSLERHLVVRVCLVLATSGNVGSRELLSFTDAATVGSATFVSSALVSRTEGTTKS